MLSTDISTFAQLRQSNSLPLAFSDQVTLKLGERSHDAQEQVRHGRIFPGKGQVLFLEANVYSAIREAEDHLAKIVQVAGQPVHRVADHCVALTHVAGQLLQLGPVEILTRRLIHETLVERKAVELSQFLLIERAYAQVADELTRPALPFVTLGSLALTISCHNSRIASLVRRYSVTHAMYRRGIP